MSRRSQRESSRMLADYHARIHQNRVDLRPALFAIVVVVVLSMAGVVLAVQ